MNTLTLDTSWDLIVDGRGNIGVSTAQAAIAQDVASAAQTFLGELWYEPNVGVPYTQDILGQNPPLTLMQEAYDAMALTVPDVVQAKTTLEPITVERTLHGVIQVIDIDGEALNTTF